MRQQPFEPMSGSRRVLGALLASCLFLAGCGTRAPDPPAEGALSAVAPAPGAVGQAAPGVAAPTESTAVPAPDTGRSAAGGPDGARSVPAAPPSPRAAAAVTPGRKAPHPPAERSPAAAGSAPGGPGPSSAAAARPSPQAAGPPVEGAATSQPCHGSLAPIVIGSVSTMSGPVGEAVKGGPLTVQAWAAAVNAKGGLRCHPVKYVIADDGADPNRHQALVQEMVERHKVIAFVYNAAVLSGYSSVNYINSKRVPVIGNEGGSYWFYDSPYFFPQGISDGEKLTESAFGAMALSGAAPGKKKVSVFACVEVPACREIYDKAEAAATKFGLNVVYKGQVTLTQPDYTSNCLRAQSSGAELVYVAMDANSTFRVAKSCGSVGFKPIYTTTSSTVNPDYATNPDFEGYIGALNSRAWFDRTNPSIVEFHSVLRQFGGGLQPNAATASGWAVAKLFEAAAQGIGAMPASDAVLRGLWSMKGNDLGGLTEPLTYMEGQPSKKLSCFWAPVVRNGKWTGGDRRYCP